MKINSIVFYGMLRSYFSWSNVLRRLANIYLNSGYDIGFELHFKDKKGIGFDKNFKLPSVIRDRFVTKDYIGDVEIAFTHPKLYKNILGKKKGAIFVYETLPIPESWIKDINQHLDFLIVPSNFVKDLCVRSGIKKRIFSIPFPIMDKIERKPKKDMVIFKSIATPHKRKNIPFMIHGFLEELGNFKDTKFILKTLPDNKKELYHWEESVSNIKNEYSQFKNVEIVDQYYDDKKMKEFFIDMDCYVQMSSSEAFGLSIFDAVKNDIPVIATNYGGYVEYLKGYFYPVDYKIGYQPGLSYGEIDMPIRAAKPKWESYKNNLRLLYNKIKKEKSL